MIHLFINEFNFFKNKINCLTEKELKFKNF